MTATPRPRELRRLVDAATGDPEAFAALVAGRAGGLTKLGFAAGFLVALGGLGLIVASGSINPPTPSPTVNARPADPPRTDLHGDPLPPGAIARMGSLRWRHHEESGSHLHVIPSPDGKLVATPAVG